MVSPLLCLALLLSVFARTTYALGHGVRNVGLGKSMILSGPKSRFLGSANNGSDIPVGGSVWPTAIYWCFVQIGTPPQDFPAAIDSGSGDLDVAGAGCDGCVTTAPNNQYDPEASSTSGQAFPKAFSNTYQTCDLTDPTAPCTISGSRYNDQVSLAGFGPVDVQVGSIESQTSNFDQFKEIDGVIGFTNGGKGDVFTQLVNGGLVENVWAMCMYEGSTSNGTLTVGGVDESLSDGPITYVTDSQTQGFHSVDVSNIVIGPASNSSSSSSSSSSVRRIPVVGGHAEEGAVPVNKGAILDTGTNILLLPPALLASVASAVCASKPSDGSDAALAECSTLWDSGGSGCASLTEAQVDAYPDMALELEGNFLLQMSSRDYLLQGSPLADNSAQYCVGVKDGGSLFIIGDTTMRHYYLVFDYANERIGWGPVNKETCGSM